MAGMCNVAVNVKVLPAQSTRNPITLDNYSARHLKCFGSRIGSRRASDSGSRAKASRSTVNIRRNYYIKIPFRVYISQLPDTKTKHHCTMQSMEVVAKHSPEKKENRRRNFLVSICIIAIRSKPHRMMDGGAGRKEQFDKLSVHPRWEWRRTEKRFPGFDARAAGEKKKIRPTLLHHRSEFSFFKLAQSILSLTANFFLPLRAHPGVGSAHVEQDGE